MCYHDPLSESQYLTGSKHQILTKVRSPPHRLEFQGLVGVGPEIVKLHSDLRMLTQLQLVGVGVDFVFPLEEEEEKEGRRNPHLASSSWNGPR